MAAGCEHSPLPSAGTPPAPHGDMLAAPIGAAWWPSAVEPPEDELCEGGSVEPAAAPVAPAAAAGASSPLTAAPHVTEGATADAAAATATAVRALKSSASRWSCSAAAAAALPGARMSHSRSEGRLVSSEAGAVLSQSTAITDASTPYSAASMTKRENVGSIL